MARLAIYDRSGSYKFTTSRDSRLLGTESSSLVITEDGRFYILLENGQRIYGKFKYVGQTMAVSYLEFTIASPYPIDWKVGDYVDYGEGILGDADTRFMLFTIPQPKKDAESGLYGGAFVYSGMQFHDCGQILSLVPFTDMQVENDNLIHFSTREGLTTFENVAGVLSRLQACCDAYRLSLSDDDPLKGLKIYSILCTSQGTYEITITPDGSVGGENVQSYEELIDDARGFSIEGSVLDGLNNIQNIWSAVGWSMNQVRCDWNYDYDERGRIVEAEESTTGIYYTFTYRDDASTTPISIKDNFGRECGVLPKIIIEVIVGGVNFVGNAGATDTMSRHNGLVNLRRYATNQGDFFTRLVPYGSERNMPGRYYNGKDILNADSVDIPNLMIPTSQWGKSYGRVHDTEYSIDYTVERNNDGSISVASAEYNNILHQYFYAYDSEELTFTVKDKTGVLVAQGTYSQSSFPGTDILPQTYRETLRMLPDARKAYIEDSAKVSEYGVIVKEVRFNDDTNGDIYPSIVGMTLQDVQDAIGYSTVKPTSENPTDELSVSQVGNEWVSDIPSMDADTLAEIKADSSYRIAILRYGYARRGKWFPSRSLDSEARRRNPRPDGESTHTTRRCPEVNTLRPLTESEPMNYQLVRRGYSNGLPALRYRIIGWDILTHGSMPDASQLTRNMERMDGVYRGASLVTRLGAPIRLPQIKENDIFVDKETGVKYYRDSKKSGITDLYIGLFHYEKGRGWVMVSNAVQVRGRVSIPGGMDNSKVWFGDESNVIYGQ